MNRKMLLLNFALLVMAGLLIWQLRVRRQTAEAHESAVLQKDGQGRAQLAPPSPAPVPPVAPAEYNDSVQRMLFAKDRNPNVIFDPPPPPKPAPPPPVMPALPRYYGQIHFGGDPVVILSPATTNEQKSYAVGEKIGDFKVLAFDRESITFEWNGGPVVKKISDLQPKDAPPQQAAVAPPPPPPQTSSLVNIGNGPSSAADPVAPGLGNDMGGGFYNCKPGDTSPSGTIVDGYRKVQSMGLMGNSCRWEKMQ
jgi:hypothetical protein